MIRKAKNAAPLPSLRPPVCRSYLRVSRSSQFKSQLGLEAQLAMIEGYRQRHPELCKMLYETTDGKPYSDPFAISGKKPFLKRPAGFTLNGRLEAGDHLIFASLDRAFRDLVDGVNCIKLWIERGITVHLVRENLVLSADKGMGMIVVKIFLLVADIEGEFARMRTMASQEAILARGGSLGGRPGQYKYDKRVPGGKRPDPYNMVCYQFMLHLHQQGMNAKAIWRKVLKMGLLNSAGGEWSFRTIDRWIRERPYELDAADWPADFEMKLRKNKTQR